MRSPALIIAALLVPLLTATPVAVDAPTSLNVFSKRAPIRPVQCAAPGDVKAYTAQAVQAAYDGIVKNANKPRKQRPGTNPPGNKDGRRYPTAYTPHKKHVQDALNAAGCALPDPNPDTAPHKVYLEFPLQDEQFEVGDSGNDRIIAIATDHRTKDNENPSPRYTDFEYCIAISYRGEKNHRGDAIICTPSTS